MQYSFNLALNNEQDTQNLAQVLATHFRSGVIYLIGDLGAGKTTLSRYFLQHLGHQGAVKSPTYTLVEPYQIQGQDIFHFDLYRLEQPEDLEEIGFYEYTDVEDEVVLIEWPDRFFAYMPEDYLHLKIERGDSEQKRIITINIEGQKYKNIYE